MDELRKLLKEGKLSFQQNFMVAFELFKEMLKNDNKEILILLFINIFEYNRKSILNSFKQNNGSCSCN